MCVAFALLSFIQLPAMVISAIRADHFFSALFFSFFHSAISLWNGSCVQHSQYNIPFFQSKSKNSHHIPLTVCRIATWKNETHLVRFSSVSLSFFDQMEKEYERTDEKNTHKDKHIKTGDIFIQNTLVSNTQNSYRCFDSIPNTKRACVEWMASFSFCFHSLLVHLSPFGFFQKYQFTCCSIELEGKRYTSITVIFQNYLSIKS